MSRHARSVFVSIFALATACSAAGCAAETTTTPADGVVGDGDAAPAASPEPAVGDIVVVGPRQVHRPKGAPGASCESADDCTGFECAHCAVFVKDCTGDHVCATEAVTCGAVSCDDADH